MLLLHSAVTHNVSAAFAKHTLKEPFSLFLSLGEMHRTAAGRMLRPPALLLYSSYISKLVRKGVGHLHGTLTPIQSVVPFCALVYL